jgi:hypothetical protein
VKSHDLRTHEGTRKGYRERDFGDAWERYLPPSPGSKRDKRDIGSSKPETAPSQARQTPGASRIENGQKPLEQADVADVADRDGGYGQNGREETLHQLGIPAYDDDEDVERWGVPGEVERWNIS